MGGSRSRQNSAFAQQVVVLTSGVRVPVSAPGSKVGWTVGTSRAMKRHAVTRALRSSETRFALATRADFEAVLFSHPESGTLFCDLGIDVPFASFGSPEAHSPHKGTSGRAESTAPGARVHRAARGGRSQIVMLSSVTRDRSGADSLTI